MAATTTVLLGPLAAAAVTSLRRTPKRVARAAEAGTEALAKAPAEEGRMVVKRKSTEALAKAPAEEAKATLAINPVTGKPKKIKVLFDPANQVGVVGEYFDPLGLSVVGQKGAFMRRRDIELKHGRIAMVAFAGLIMQHFVHINVDPWSTFVKTSPNSLGAVSAFYGLAGFGTLSIGFGVIALLESIILPGAQGDYPGNYGDPAGFGQYTREMRTAELQNGRFAMLGVSTAFLIESVTGLDAVEQLTAPFGFVLQTLAPEPEGPAVVIPLTS